jgi:hypothetical protein
MVCLLAFDTRPRPMSEGAEVLSLRETSTVARQRARTGPGTLAIWPGYGAGNPRFFVSGCLFHVG